MSKHRYSNFPSTQVNGDDFIAHQASSVNLGTDELEDMAWSDSDADMEDSESDWSLSHEESDQEDDDPKNRSSLTGDTKFIVYKVVRKSYSQPIACIVQTGCRIPTWFGEC